MSPSCRRWVLVSLLGVVTTGPAWAEGPPRAGGRVDAVGDPLPPGAILRLGTARFRAGGGSLALSPDGKLIAAAGQDGIRLLDMVTGKELRRCRGNFFGREQMTFSPDSKLLAVCDFDCVYLYDVARDNYLARLEEEGDREPGPVVFSANGKVMAAWGGSRSQKTSVRVWEVATRKKIADLDVPKANWVRVGLSPDGKVLAFWGEPSLAPGNAAGPAVQLWDLATKKELRRLELEGYRSAAVTFSPDGKHLAVAESPPAVSIWEVATGKQLHRSAARRSTGPPFAYSPDGKVLAAGSEGGVVQAWDAATGRRTALTRGPQCELTGLGFRPGNRLLAAGLAYHAVHLWEVPSGKVLTPRVGHQAEVAAVGFLPDGKTVFSAAADGVRFWAAANGKEVRRFVAHRRDERVLHPVYVPAPGGKYLACGAHDRLGLQVLEAATGDEVFTVEESAALLRGEIGAAFSAGGEIVATLGEVLTPNGRDFEVRLWDLATGRGLQRLRGEGGPSFCLALSEDGGRVALAVNGYSRRAGPNPAWVRVWDAGTGKELARFFHPGGRVRSLAFAPNGALLATAGDGPAAQVWDAASGRELCRMETEERLGFTGVVFSPDGRMLAAATWGRPDEERKVVLWEMVSGKARAEFLGHRGPVTALAFSPDGRTLATGGADTTVLLWELFGREAGKARPSPQELEGLWADLAGLDAARAHRAMRRLAAAPREAVALLGKHVRPAPGKPPGEKEMERLIADLDSDSFKTREKARRELGRVGLPARDALVKARAAKPSLEKKRRLEELIDALSRAAGPSPEMVQPTRALEVLERVGTPEARKVLEALAGGNPSARLTREAKATLERLARRPAPSP